MAAEETKGCDMCWFGLGLLSLYRLSGCAVGFQIFYRIGLLALQERVNNEYRRSVLLLEFECSSSEMTAIACISPTTSHNVQNQPRTRSMASHRTRWRVLVVLLSLSVTTSACFQSWHFGQRGKRNTMCWASTLNEEASISWVDSLGRDKRHTDGPAVVTNHKQVSILSWNILAQSLFDKSRMTGNFYKHIGPNAIGYTWDDRLPRIMELIREADADIVCLQEVELASYRMDLEPAMAELGYKGIVQGEEGVKDTKKKKKTKSPRAHLVASFWKTERYKPVKKVPHLARTRTLTTVLQSNDDRSPVVEQNGRYLAVINCHLEGHPLKSSARVRQLHHALRDLSNRHARLHGLVVCGDFNCELQGSACTTYLQVGCCRPQCRSPKLEDVSGDAALALPGAVLEFDEALDDAEPIFEWGTPVPGNELECVPAHPYRANVMMSAFPSSLGRDDPREHFTYAAQPGHPVAGLDQIWLTGTSLRTAALKRMLHSDAERCHVLETGLPNQIIPSDHLPIGCVLEWESSRKGNNEDLSKPRELVVTKNNENRNGQSTSGKTLLRDSRCCSSSSSSISAQDQVQRLLSDCPFESIEQRKEFDFVVSEVPGLPKGGKKPSDDQILQLIERRNRKKKLLDTASEDVSDVLKHVIKLKKEVSQLSR